MDIKLNIERTGSDGDLSFISGKLSLTESKAESVAQALSIELSTHLGEWLFNRSYGVDWMGQFFVKGTSKYRSDSFMKYQILRNKNINSIASFSSTLDANRKYSCNFIAVTNEGKQYVVDVSVSNDNTFYVSFSDKN